MHSHRGCHTRSLLPALAVVIGLVLASGNLLTADVDGTAGAGGADGISGDPGTLGLFDVNRGGLQSSALDLFFELMNPAASGNGAVEINIPFDNAFDFDPGTAGVQPLFNGSLQDAVTFLVDPTVSLGALSDFGAGGAVDFDIVADVTSSDPGASFETDVIFGSSTVTPRAMPVVTNHTIDLDTGRVGDAVTAQDITVANTASGALTDVLRETGRTVDAPFAGAASPGDIAAGDSAVLAAPLDTSAAGGSNGAKIFDSVSHSDAMSDLVPDSETVLLTGTVNDLAEAAFQDPGDPAALASGRNGVDAVQVPEPSTAVLLVAALLVIYASRRRHTARRR